MKMATTKKSKQQFLNKVLKEVNRVRKTIYSKASELQQLPKGLPNEADACPLANAFYNKFDVSEYDLEAYANVSVAKRIAKLWKKPISVDNNGFVTTVQLPSVLKQFVQKFDEERFPELIFETNND
jgi:hypothetical protein